MACVVSRTHTGPMAVTNPFTHQPVTWLVVFVIAMTALEALARRHRGITSDRVDTRTSLTLGLAYLTVKIVGGRLLFLGIAFWIYDHLRLFTISTTSVTAWIGAFLLGDFVYYWVHRCEHRYRVLWSSHLVHHSSTEFTFTTAVRNPWTEILYKPITGLWAPFLGVQPMMAAALGTIGLMIGLLQHTSLVSTLGVADHALMTPLNHRIHHASNELYLDKNFGGTLLIWDRMFGTYATETTVPIFGITKPLPGRDPWSVGLGGYPELVGELRSTRGRDRVALLFARP